MNYIHDYTEDEGKFRAEVTGRLAFLQHHKKSKLCFVNAAGDYLTIGELINACGYTTKSVAGRRILITIEDYNE